MIRTAFVLGAGLGTRLKTLTAHCPKPLIPIANRPLITFALDHLIAAGVDRFVINTHHLAERFEAALPAGEYRGRPVQLVYEPVRLETGGGIKNAERWIGREPFLVYSGDILTDLDLGALIATHFRDGNDVTMALRDTGFSSGVTLDGARVTDIRGRYAAPGTRHDFANVSVWSPAIYDRIPGGEKKSFVPVLSDWIGAGGRIGGVLLNERGWFNVGSREEYLGVHREMATRQPAPWIHPAAQVESGAEILGASAIGAGARIGAGAVVRDCILWAGAEVAPDARLERCIVTGGSRAAGVHVDADFA